ncbi:hypothetical protein BN1058_01694 [Paraliobacillus sp. PM-2]|uniref:hypothetical protein n=1 Tax=Paraliobacillus sp. PM-2 TaxID=1462524 RepID=UPI00061C86AF|nr:hypothetical protein [Paraliobacillus sp. PM-2]CQR47383.1 hypothetical protein BN1058_01694 [Paraliobacillus sp. PM-2]
MKRLNKKAVTATVALVGTLVLGSTVYGLAQSKHLQETRTAIEQEQESLDSLSAKLESYQSKDGYLSKDLTVEKLDEIKNSLNLVKDSYIDFHIEKDDLKEDIKVIKIDKKAIKQELKVLNRKLIVQKAVNSLFEDDVLIGNKVSKQAIAHPITEGQINLVKTKYIGSVSVGSKWENAIKSIVDEATSQLKQVRKAEQEVIKAYKNNSVIEGVSRDTYKKAKTEVDKVVNQTIKDTLSGNLGKVLEVIEDNEAESERLAKEKEQAEAQQVQKQSTSGTKSSSSTSTKSSTTTTKKSTSSSGTTTKKPSSGNTSGSKSDGSWTAEDVVKTGEGSIKNHGGSQEGSNTYETGTFVIPSN